MVIFICPPQLSQTEKPKPFRWFCPPPPPWFILQDLFETILYTICLGNSFLVELFMFSSLYKIIADSGSWIWFFWSINQPDCTLSVRILLSYICIWILNCLMVSRYEDSKILDEDIKTMNQNPTTMPMKKDTTPLSNAKSFPPIWTTKVSSPPLTVPTTTTTCTNHCLSLPFWTHLHKRP